MILRLFQAQPDHPLADARECRRILGEIPLDNAFRAVEEVSGWLSSLAQAEGFRPDHLFDIARQLDMVAQPHLTRLTQDYLHTPRLSKSEERKIRSLNSTYWSHLAEVLDLCLQKIEVQPLKAGRGKALDEFRSQLSLLAGCAQVAAVQSMKWISFRHGAVPEVIWLRAGRAYRVAEMHQVAQKVCQPYRQPGSASITVERKYLHALLFDASSLSCLSPREIEMADRLIAHFVNEFEFVAEAQAHSVYWADASLAQGPTRMAKLPQVLSPFLRFFSPGTVPESMAVMIREVESGRVPETLDPDGKFSPAAMLPVLRHLARYWAAQPPLRVHPRHGVRAKMAVVRGFENCFGTLAGQREMAESGGAESWVVENVSMGGFGACIDRQQDAWPKAGALLGLQPEGGNNWMLGVVRRFAWENESKAGLGIQTLSRHAASYQFVEHGEKSAPSPTAVPGIRLADSLPETGEAHTVRLVLPPESFKVSKALEYADGGRRYRLNPVELIERTPGFDMALYRENVVAG